MNKVVFSHNSDDWKTPSNIYRHFVDLLKCVDCFPYQSSNNQLDQDYKGKKLFINPPFSKMNKYVDWIIKQIDNGNIVYLLIPSRTDTIYFHKLLSRRPLIYFFKGRLRYNDSNVAPFPSMLLVFGLGYTLPIYHTLSSDMDVLD